jgi:putative tricarboxylic transport membrane protein
MIGGIAIYGSVRLDVGTLREPGTGFLPFLAGGVICLLSGVILFQNALKKGRAGGGSISSLWKGARLRNLFALGFLLFAYVFAFEEIGFVLTSSIVLFAIFRFVEGLSWTKTIVVSLAASVSSYLFLSHLLRATLPKGLFGF